MTFSVGVPIPAIVAFFDRDRIVQVLSNLLGNALKFTPREGAVHLHAVRGEGQIEFVLRDSGPGIHSTALPHVFERFWQIDSDTRRGLGLGLYICEKIVALHGGRIWAESEFGNGATFRFTLPLDDA
jgi:signal transduction histidine kinase